MPRKEPGISLFAAPRSSEAGTNLPSQHWRKRIAVALLLLLPTAITILFSPISVAQSIDEKSGSGYHGALLPSDLAGPAIEQKVDALLKQMNLDEKIGQLVQYSVGTPTGPGTGRGNYEEMVEKGQVGSLFNLAGVQSANRFQHIAVEKSRLHIPLLYGLDMIHGYRTTFPVPLAMASTWDPQLVEKVARTEAKEAYADGVRWTFSPMVDISRDSRWGRIIESAGEDPYLDGVIARAYVRGYQGKKLNAPGSVAACPKHYVGYGAVEGGRDYNTVEISEHTLREVYLPPFYGALNEGAPTIMSAFSSLDGVPATANPFTLKQILRQEWKFPGLAVSDWSSVGELIPHGIAKDGKTAAWRAFAAGVDMDMESNLYHEHLAELVRSGKVTVAQIDEAVRHVLRVKFALGLFESPYTDEKLANPDDGPLPKENLELARTAAEESFVLLKNEARDGRATLPLSKKVRSVALIGPLGDDAAEMLGSWAGRGRPQDVVTVKTALSNELGAQRVRFAKGGDIRSASDAQIEEAVAAAKNADVAILSLGEDGPEMTGEAASRAHLDLPGRQEELAERIVATGKPVVLLLFSGRALTLPWIFEHVPAVVAVWFPGVQAGPAIVRTLFGEAVPSGKLVISWPRYVGQEPLYYNAMNTGRPPDNTDLTHAPRSAPEKFTSRYIDEPNAPQFPFGYGLSYGEFVYGPAELNVKKLSAKKLDDALREPGTSKKEVLTVSTEVKNTGEFAGEEVVELYVRLQGTSVEEPVRKLKTFERVSLAAGESKKVTFKLGADTFSIWDIHNELTVEPSMVHIWVSPDSSRGDEGGALQIEE
ncbi:MAG TPA: glycoside hydrolase family 3 N-terminal domain-containing protein [Candidatus Acidoferrum sp.]